MLYFAYGSNMSLRRIAARVGPIGPGETGEAGETGETGETGAVARLTEHRLTFTKRGWRDGSGKCGFLHTGEPHDAVYGVVFDVHDERVSELDRHEGVGRGYERRTVVVLGHGERALEVETYVATALDVSLRPFSWYVEHVVRGASEAGLPEEYVGRLARTHSLPDPDSQRAARELRIYGRA